MITEVHTKTITEVRVKKQDFIIHCFSDTNEDGTTTPSIAKSDLLKEPKIVNNVSGKEGELLLSIDGDNIETDVNESGELIINSQNLEAENYSRDGESNENLLYIL